jgi:hypothetical protein
MNFVPLQDFADRAISRYNAESQGIDAIAFRITDHRQANAMINAVARGVPVRIITEPSEYRNPERMGSLRARRSTWLWHCWILLRSHPRSGALDRRGDRSDFRQSVRRFPPRSIYRGME